MGFADDVRKFQEKALLAANKSTNKVVEELFTKVVDKSPTPPGIGGYSEGVLKNQWYPTSGSGYSGEVGTSASNIGAGSMSRIKSLLSEDLFYGRDNIVSLANNTEQAYYAEVLGWLPGKGTNGWIWSGNVGPYRMVSMSIVEVVGKYG